MKTCSVIVKAAVALTVALVISNGPTSSSNDSSSSSSASFVQATNNQWSQASHQCGNKTQQSYAGTRASLAAQERAWQKKLESEVNAFGRLGTATHSVSNHTGNNVASTTAGKNSKKNKKNKKSPTEQRSNGSDRPRTAFNTTGSSSLSLSNSKASNNQKFSQFCRRLSIQESFPERSELFGRVFGAFVNAINGLPDASTGFPFRRAIDIALAKNLDYRFHGYRNLSRFTRARKAAKARLQAHLGNSPT